MVNNSKNSQHQLLENIIEKLVREAISTKRTLTESDKDANDGQGKSSKDADYKRKYKAVQKALSDDKIDATQVMAKALGFDPDDDVARSHAFKKLHKKSTPDGNNVYQFTPAEVGKIFTQIP